MDKNAVPAAEIKVKLRHGETNAKLSRTPMNLESAILSLAVELIDLSGEMAVYQLFDSLGELLAKEFGHEDQKGAAVGAIVQCLVNMPRHDASDVAKTIVGELRDMELI